MAVSAIQISGISFRFGISRSLTVVVTIAPVSKTIACIQDRIHHILHSNQGRYIRIHGHN